MFLDGKVVKYIFRLSIFFDFRMVDLFLFVCIILVIKYNSVKIVFFFCFTLF